MVAAQVGGPFATLALVAWLAHTVHSLRPAHQEAVPMAAVTAPHPDTDHLRALVVVPTLDEAPNIEPLLRGIRGAAPSVDVLVVDDASADGTADVAERLGRHLGHVTVLRRQGPPGLGAAYRDGFTYAVEVGYDAVVEMDADLSHDPAAISALLDRLEHGADVALGSRYAPGGSTPGWPRSRRLLSRAASCYARAVLRLPATDPTGGFRAFRTSFLEDCDVSTVGARGFAFQLETLHRAARLDASIAEVPITFHDRTAGSSKLSARIAREALVLVARLRVHPWTPRTHTARAAKPRRSAIDARPAARATEVVGL
jgi:dolichol-phosphate mannosyltransferase